MRYRSWEKERGEIKGDRRNKRKKRGGIIEEERKNKKNNVGRNLDKRYNDKSKRKWLSYKRKSWWELKENWNTGKFISKII